ncbi:MAG TPA: putative DNA binding domain-containing protein [Candidatus Mediterraneibacter merdavium]|nr:putative DNA binding domain-containing protein [Candidatus Mediterraneibacter merdavium]
MNIGTETEWVEFKKTTGELREGIISLASMLNKNGKGILYFGVRNDGEVVGQQIGDRTMREISQGIANAIKPQIIPTIITELCDEKNIIKVTVNGEEKPYSAYGKYYMRSADEDREISPGQLRTLMLSIADTIVNIEANNQELTFEQLKTLYAGNELTLRENTFKQNLNLLTRNGTYNLMASILADVNSYSIKVAVFRGSDKTDLMKRNEYGYKCMLVAVKQVLDYIEALNETTVDLSGSLRKESKLFDFSCFREAWLNACLHNRWSRQTPPAVYVFDNRIEIVSVGGLPEGLTLEEFYEGKSKPVNLELQQIMVQLDYIEQTGHGVPLIVSRYGKEVFDITENFITVTIPFNNVKEKGRLQRDEGFVPDECDRKILNLMEEDSGITVRGLSEQMGLGMTTITKHIRVLREMGVIEREGSKKSGQWRVNKLVL